MSQSFPDFSINFTDNDIVIYFPYILTVLRWTRQDFAPKNMILLKVDSSISFGFLAIQIFPITVKVFPILITFGPSPNPSLLMEWVVV